MRGDQADAIERELAEIDGLVVKREERGDCVWLRVYDPRVGPNAVYLIIGARFWPRVLADILRNRILVAM